MLVEVTNGNDTAALSSRVATLTEPITNADGTGFTAPDNCCMGLPSELTLKSRQRNRDKKAVVNEKEK